MIMHGETKRKQRHLIREGEYLAEVEVELIENQDDPWAPYLSHADACKLDNVRRALMKNDLATASSLASVYRVTPLNAA